MMFYDFWYLTSISLSFLKTQILQDANFEVLISSCPDASLVAHAGMFSSHKHSGSFVEYLHYLYNMHMHATLKKKKKFIANFPNLSGERRESV